MAKKRVGVFSLTGCAGDQMQILNLEGLLLVLAQEVEIVHFPMAKQDNDEGPFDIAFVEGAVTTAEEIEKIKDIRSKSKLVVALGTCACFGGVPNIRNFMHENLVCAVYPPGAHVDSICATGIDYYVKVDYYLRGCPVNRKELLEIFQSLVAGKIPVVESKPVCVECRAKENKCLMPISPCMGPISQAGCDAICTTYGFPCEGCRGPSDDANIHAEIMMFQKFHGLSKEEIRKKLLKFAGSSKRYGEMLCRGELE